MSHILVILDASGKEIARVPVKAGYTVKEIPAATKPAAAAPADKDVSAGDSGSGTEAVG